MKFVKFEEIYQEEEEKFDFMKGLIRIARADGVIAPEEQIMFANAVVGAGITENAAKELQEALVARDIKKEYFAMSFPKKKQSLYFLREAIQLSNVDGKYDPQEKKEIKAIAKELNISSDNVKALEKWVKAGLAWRKEGDKLLNIR